MVRSDPAYIEAKEMVSASGPCGAVHDHIPSLAIGKSDDGHPFKLRYMYISSATDKHSKTEERLFKLDVSTDLIPAAENGLFVEPTTGYDMPEIIAEISAPLLKLKPPMRVGVSFLSDIDLVDRRRGWCSGLYFCHPSKAKYLFLAVWGSKVYDRYDTDSAKQPCRHLGETLVINYPGRPRLKSISTYCLSQLLYETRKTGPHYYLFTGGRFYCYEDFPCGYVDYWVIPMGYSCHEPLNPDLAASARRERAKEYEEIAIGHLTDPKWCANQRSQFFQEHCMACHEEEYCASHEI